ncbi:class I SAM-dependent methyltransferase [Parafilimonas terrae]|jgi:23S rRNA (cytosine1962-C5)-methyltransferase|uniref:23S rRNA (Cytosine1962-C5)-methyltransferase n=1 Tax=Parafilimonas terrae TaxID=1465490 RepID=A0A1I5XZ27_9BACT|nr:class I SAM-dependent methyltransferase [Parafilimonas terrae]SFQ37166.1 23S rRNA (cytosine1962-C5)-methyltransferase [Parafilimonas terrae]
MFQNRLLKVYKHKSKQARRLNISCYRIYDHDLPEFPFAIELYADKIYVAEYRRRHGMDDEEHETWLQQSFEIISEVLQLPAENIYSRERKRQSHREKQQYEKQNSAEEFFKVEENGLKFLVNLTDYLDTGLFLDHRITREMVRKEADGKRVLNLFCYTGSFSVYAASGNAASVTSVDLSKTYLDWAKDNFIINGFKNTDQYHFIHADVLQYLKTLQPNSFDLIILDPPTFSNSKRMKDFFDVQKHHTEIINDALLALSVNGILYFSTNYSRFVLDAAGIHTAVIKDITKATTPFDFEGKLKRFCFKLVK